MTTVVAVAWLHERDWQRWQSIDGELLPYAGWLRKTESLIVQAQLGGALVVKILVDPDSFVAWCKASGKAINRQSRALYAAAELMRRRRHA